MATTTNLREAKYNEILSSDLELRCRWSMPPKVYASSAPHFPGKDFYMIWLCLASESPSLFDLWSVIRRTVELGIDNQLFEGMVGAEIVPCLKRSDDVVVTRILRLSFFTPSIEALLKLQPTSLLSGDILPGQVRCSWYMPSDRVVNGLRMD
jgi:hypothetical protein